MARRKNIPATDVRTDRMSGLIRFILQSVAGIPVVPHALRLDEQEAQHSPHEQVLRLGAYLKQWRQWTRAGLAERAASSDNLAGMTAHCRSAHS